MHGEEGEAAVSNEDAAGGAGRVGAAPLATCTAGCRELLAECEWGTDDEQAEADSLLVIQPFLAPKLYTKALFFSPKMCTSLFSTEMCTRRRICTPSIRMSTTKPGLMA